MKFLLLGLLIGSVVAILVWIAEENINNAHCSLQNQGHTLICRVDGKIILAEVINE
jgi:prepilin signal peptidase PulO-like enzyme (type II secretory pathway)